ncbi:hypothetical protein N8I77_004839 [Diaporthe amygdali]|uniref:Uncharacterized protein n=1 Tax=Phomopsis amygdali TaxID=1214568 RepID=A0AAD9SKL4_PHOAM|nr:hypothetical protein N8I77_004839 [Diaporthe amygdali]
MPVNVNILPRHAAIDLAYTSATTPPRTDAIVLHVFCDASSKRTPKLRAGIGVVVKIWHPREPKRTNQLVKKACPIPYSRSDNNDIVEAFALAEGAFVAIDQIWGLMSRSLIIPTDRLEVSLWSDSKMVLRAMENPRRFRAHTKKMQHVLNMIELKTLELQDSSSDVSVHFNWCPGECVQPHALADEKSKRVRILGGGKASKAFDLFKNLPHSAIKSALRQPPQAVSSVTSPGNRSPSDAASPATAKSPPPAPETPAIVEDIESQTVTTDSLQPSDIPVPSPLPASRLVPVDPIVAYILHQAARTSQFFSMVAAAAESLPSHQRRTMCQAIRQQQDANKTPEAIRQVLAAELGSDHQLSASIDSDPFLIIEAAALKLLGHEKEDLLAAIDLQKKRNRHIAERRALGEGYESDSNEESEMGDEPEVVEAPRQGRLQAVWHWVERKLTGL